MRVVPLSFLPLLIFVHVSCGKSEAHSVTPQTDQSALHIVQGRQAYWKKDYEKAEMEFKKALTPNHIETNLLAHLDLGKLYYAMAIKEKNSNTRLTRLNQSLSHLDKFLMGAESAEELKKEYRENKALKKKIKAEIDTLMAKPDDMNSFKKPTDSYQKMLEAPPHWASAQRNFTIRSYGGGSSQTSSSKSSKEPGPVEHYLVVPHAESVDIKDVPKIKMSEAEAEAQGYTKDIG